MLTTTTRCFSRFKGGVLRYFSAFRLRRGFLGMAWLMAVSSVAIGTAHAQGFPFFNQSNDSTDFQLTPLEIFSLINAIMGNGPVDDRVFDRLFRKLAGENCEKDDTHAQQLLLGPFQQLNQLLEGQNAFNTSNWKDASSDEIVTNYGNTIPMAASPKKPFKDPFITEVLTTAIPIHKGMIASMRRVCGPKHVRVARGLNFLAELYKMQNDYLNAKDALLEAKSIMTIEYPKHPDTAGIHNNLGWLYLIIGEYDNAQQHFETALALAKSIDSLGPNHPNTLIGLQNLAGVYIALGKYAHAEQQFQEALNVLVSSRKPTVSETESISQQYDKARGAFRGDFEGDREAALRQNMAHFYGAILGDYEKAERLLQEALALTEKEALLHHPIKGMIYQGLGWIDQQQGNYSAAKEQYEKALNIYRTNLEWKYSRFSVMTFTQLGYIYQLQGDRKAAEGVLQQAINISGKVSEPKASRANLISMSSLHLAMFYHSIGELDKAEPLFKDALKNFQRILRKEHPVIMQLTQHLAALKFDQGQIAEAVTLAKEAQRLAKQVLTDILSFGTEQQRLAYQARSYPYDLLARVANKTGDATPLANAILQNKGIVLDSLIEDYQLAGNPEIKAKMQSLKWQLMNNLMTVHQDNSEAAKAQRASERERLERELKQLESGLAQQVGQARKALKVEFQDVQAALPQDGVLVEFIRYKHFVGLQDHAAHYGAVIIPKQGEPQWVYLDTAEVIEQNILQYQSFLRCDRKKQKCNRDEKSFKQLLISLYQQIWTPIENQLNGVTTVILSPDGELNFLSFATLLSPSPNPKEKVFLVNKFDLYYVASGRDLRRDIQDVNESTMVVYALKDWQSHPVKSKTRNRSDFPVMRSVDQQAYRNFKLDPLKGTIKEAEELNKIAKSQNWAVKTFFDSDATEERLYQLTSSPRILHFATHGVFLHAKNDQERAPSFFSISSGVTHTSRLELFSNPMLRSFLALAGAQTTLDAWNTHKSSSLPEPNNDGILTADEVSSLKLKGTWLTTLSACDTGRGEGRAGEGVLGLRRGFVRAGTQNLLMTLWPTVDKVSHVRKFRRTFYQRVLSNHNAPKVLNDMQKDLPKLWKKTRSLIDAVSFVGPFVISFQGPLELENNGVMSQ